MLVALAAALVSGILWFVFVTAGMSGLSFREAMHPDVLSIVWSTTRFGADWRWRAIFWVGCVICMFWGHRMRWPATIFAALFVASLAWAGHGQTGLAPRWHLWADVAHLLTASIWPAGLLPFFWLWLKLRRSTYPSTDPGRWSDMTQLARRFSATSLIAVVMLAATGLINSYCLLGSIGAVISTAYGRMLLVKIALFLVMIALGAVNLLCLKPRICRDKDSAGPSSAMLQMTVGFELMIGTLILIVIGLLGMLAPADL
jgi:putative copper resistance protein D